VSPRRRRVTEPGSPLFVSEESAVYLGKRIAMATKKKKPATKKKGAKKAKAKKKR
jgi:hypothetical protein